GTDDPATRKGGGDEAARFPRHSRDLARIGRFSPCADRPAGGGGPGRHGHVLRPEGDRPLSLDGGHEERRVFGVAQGPQRLHPRRGRARITGAGALAARIKTLDDAGPPVGSVQGAEGRYFYFKPDPGTENRRLFWRERLDAPERLLLDTEKQSTKEKHYSI